VTAQFEWDDAKAASNFAKHGISFATATAAFDDPDCMMFPTVRAIDGEDRFKAVGSVEGRLYTVICVKRGAKVR
jgi:hypothetical protein